MGTDIHMVIEVRGANGWTPTRWPNPWHGQYEDEPLLTLRAYSDRNYDAFAILGNVRNGTGFAGIETGDGFEYISEQRGIPIDAHPETWEYVEGTGDHSTTWCSVSEILAFDWSQTTRKRGWVNGPQFEEWDRVRRWEPAPRSYCGDVMGRTIMKISPAEMQAHLARLRKKWNQGVDNEREGYRLDLEAMSQTYCQIEWGVNYARAAGSFWTEWVPRLLQLGAPCDVRLVYSFDS